MENKNIEIANHGGLKCDNPNCDWQDDTIDFKIYGSWLNKPCPKCGENVLTEEDFLRAEVVRASIDLVNSMTPEELEEFSSKINIEALKNEPFFSETIGLENLNTDKDDFVIMTVNTHEKINAVEIKRGDD